MIPFVALSPYQPRHNARLPCTFPQVLHVTISDSKLQASLDHSPAESYRLFISDTAAQATLPSSPCVPTRAHPITKQPCRHLRHLARLCLDASNSSRLFLALAGTSSCLLATSYELDHVASLAAAILLRARQIVLVFFFNSSLSPVRQNGLWHDGGLFVTGPG